MIIDNTNIWNSPRRQITAKVELFNGSTLANTFNATDALSGFTIERTGADGKFFGFGVAQVLKLNLLDKNRTINLTKENAFKAYVKSSGDYLNAFPIFYLAELTRDENTNELSIVAKDKLSKASDYVVRDLNLSVGYSIRNVAEAIAQKLELGLVINNEISFAEYFGEGANFDGAETLREVLNAIAEATQTIYFINANNELVFKRLNQEEAAVLTIDKSVYIDLDSKPARTLTAVVSATELGENYIAKEIHSASGETIELTEVEDFIDFSARTKNLFQPNLFSWGNNCYNDNGVIRQTEVDTATEFYMKVSTVSGYAPLGISKWVSTPQRLSWQITCSETITGFYIGVNGSAKDTMAAYPNLILEAGIYTISLDLINATQGELAWTNIQIEKGSTATPYTPYIADTTAVRVRAQGKNLFDVSKIANSATITNNGDGTLLVKNNGGQDSGRTFKELCQELKVGDTFTFSLRTTNAVMDSKVGGYIYIAGSYTNVLNSGSTYTATQEMLEGGVWLYKAPYEYQDQVEEGIVSEIQVELGSAATDYEPYAEAVEYEQGDDIAVISPTTVLIPTTSGAILDIRYYEIDKTEGSTTQYVRENPFWDLNENVTTFVEQAYNIMKGLTIYPFECQWRGNPALEIGDKINLITKDDEIISSFVLNDTIKYNGGLNMVSTWKIEESAPEHANPSTLGDVIKQTFAKVDKVNQEITIIAGETATIKATSKSVEASVRQLDENVVGLTKEVESKMSAEAVEISIQKALEGGAEKVTTSTGYRFDETGLTVSKSGSEISTQITEDGMTVQKDTTPVLVANNEGVKAEDLHATTFLIIGGTSRFEDYGGSRTGCFWILK